VKGAGAFEPPLFSEVDMKRKRKPKRRVVLRKGPAPQNKMLLRAPENK
jgi:hypothetical protein